MSKEHGTILCWWVCAPSSENLHTTLLHDTTFQIRTNHPKLQPLGSTLWFSLTLTKQILVVLVVSHCPMSPLHTSHLLPCRAAHTGFPLPGPDNNAPVMQDWRSLPPLSSYDIVNNIRWQKKRKRRRRNFKDFPAVSFWSWKQCDAGKQRMLRVLIHMVMFYRVSLIIILVKWTWKRKVHREILILTLYKKKISF